jgi:hypothetical protein
MESMLCLCSGTSQDVQKGRLARPRRVKRRGGTYQASLDPLASIKCERIDFLPQVPALRRGPERCQNKANGRFQHPVKVYRGGSAAGRSDRLVPLRRRRVPCQGNRTNRRPSSLLRFAWRALPNTGLCARSPDQWNERRVSNMSSMNREGGGVSRTPPPFREGAAIHPFQ